MRPPRRTRSSCRSRFQATHNLPIGLHPVHFRVALCCHQQVFSLQFSCIHCPYFVFFTTTSGMIISSAACRYLGKPAIKDISYTMIEVGMRSVAKTTIITMQVPCSSTAPIVCNDKSWPRRSNAPTASR